jgi:hypothetical protein
LPADGFRGLLALIRKSLSHENEVRIVAKSPALSAIPTRIEIPLPDDPTDWPASIDGLTADDQERHLSAVAGQARQAFQNLRQSGKEGFHLPLALDDMFLEVVLKPGCSAGYESEVLDQLSQAGLGHVKVRPSAL